MTTTFLVGVDGSEGARKAAHYAAERARAEKARLLLVTIVEPTPYAPTMPEELPIMPVEPRDEIDHVIEHVLKPLEEELAAADLEIELMVSRGRAADQLNNVAREHHVDQVFTGRRGRSRVASLLFGSVSRALVQSCPVPITVVPHRSLHEESPRTKPEAEAARGRSDSPVRG